MDKLIPLERAENRIYFLRGKKVMLDRDLAELYGVKSIRLREQVKRNKNRFPGDFMFQLTEDEVDSMVSQFAIPSKKHLGGYSPYAFTEHGALMLASVLNSKRAIKMGIFIVRAFVKMREMISAHKDLVKKVDEMEKKYNIQFKMVFDSLRKIIDPPMGKSRKRIGFLRGGEA